MKQTVTVIDYGLGNLLSVSRALEHVGACVELTDSAAAIDAATVVVLPGVGAFRDGLAGLHERGLVEPLRRYGRSGRPLLGICLGMQLLFEWSEEFGKSEGLGLISGGVSPISTTGANGRSHKIPHIGWNELKIPAGRLDWRGTLLEGTPQGTAAYFVHSYACVPAEDGDRLADCDYDGCTVSAAVQRGPLSGAQFHPEKSGPAGLAMLKAFLNSAGSTC